VIMSFGKMNGFASIVSIQRVKDSEGFTTEQEVTLASFRCYREGRHGSERWANLAAFSEATDLFRFRTIPGLTVTTEHFLVYGGERFDITSVEDIKGRGMYTEVLGKRMVSSIG
jgi:head-tail adaptor